MTSEIEIQTSVGSILPWVRRLVRTLKTLRNPHNGYVEISFDPDGIRIACSEHGRLDISEEFIPRNQIGVFEELYERDQYMGFDPRRLYYDDLEALQTWLNCFFPERRITIGIEADERDICIESGGIRNYFGESDCQRPERMEMIFSSEISRYPEGLHIWIPISACGKEYDLYQMQDGTPILYGASASHPAEKLAGYRYVGTYAPVVRKIEDEDWCGIVIAGFPDGDDHAGVYDGRIAIGGGCIKFEREEKRA